jgi:ABC-2 type transport system ATP-binding protein
MSKNIAIQVDHVSKMFKLPHEKTTTIKGAVVNFYKRNKSYEKQQVLNDISFEIKQGDFFGIVGRNGSGKSTLLKLLAGIYSPNAGNIQVHGKLTPFIELGVGFNPELTGRENVYLNGALLGFNRKEVEALYGDIVEFAELEKFMDQKLKNYSSGMQVRLAFSIAIQAKSDILVLDEVLAVGDEAFQAKCVKVFDEYKENKQTVVLVTHDMETVKKYCNRAILISDGSIIARGDPHEIAAQYSKLNQPEDVAEDLQTNNELKVKILKRQTNKTRRYGYGEKMALELSWSTKKQVGIVGVAVYSSVGERVYATNTILDKFKLSSKQTIKYEVELKIGAGNYYLMVGIWNEDRQIIEFIAHGPDFTMEDAPDIPGEGLTRLSHKWEQG